MCSEKYFDACIPEIVAEIKHSKVLLTLRLTVLVARLQIWSFIVSSDAIAVELSLFPFGSLLN